MNKVSIRASSLATLFDCAYRWEGEQLLGFSSQTNGRMHLGNALHASTAIMDESKMDGFPLDQGEIYDLFDESFNHSEYSIDWAHDDLKRNDAEKIGLNLNEQYFHKITEKTIFSQVERKIEPATIEVEKYKIAIELTGRLDRSRTVVQGVGNKIGHGIVDLKSGKLSVNKDGYAKTKGHAIQIGVYELLDEMSSDYKIDMPAKIIGLKTSTKPVIGEGFIYGAKDRLVGDENNPGYIEMAAQILSSGLFPPNSKSMLCSKKYCSRWSQCPYKDD